MHKSVCAFLHLSSPQRSLGCESHRLEVSGPGGCEVCEKPCGGKRGISSFNLFYSPETAQLYRENSHIDIKVVVFFASSSKPSPTFPPLFISPMASLAYFIFFKSTAYICLVAMWSDGDQLFFPDSLRKQL